MGETRKGRGLCLALVLTVAPGCGVVGTTCRATKFVVKTTVDVGKAGVKVVTWPFRAIHGNTQAKADNLARASTQASGPEPVIAGHLSTEDRAVKPAAGPVILDEEPRVLAAEPDDVRLR